MYGSKKNNDRLRAVLLTAVLWLILDCSLLADGLPKPVNLRLANSELVNIAKDKPYSFEKKPNYRWCTDAGDIKQLTDGEYTKGYFWEMPSTVGWNIVNPVIIQLDLKSVTPISGISYSTAAGVAGVHWPKNIFLFLADESNDFRYAGDLIELDQNRNLPAYGTYAAYKFQTTALRAKGRYIKLVIVPTESFTFVDEIEVFKGSQTLSEMPINSVVVDDFDAFARNQRMISAVKRRLNYDMEAVRQSMNGIRNGQELDDRLDTIEKEIQSLTEIQVDGFSTRFPINELHAKIFRAQAAIWRKQGQSPLTLWRKNRWDMVSPTEPPSEGAPQLDVKMMRNEHRSDAFNITNTGDKIVRISLSIVGFPKSTGTGSSFVTVHCGQFTDTASGAPVMAALPSMAHLAEEGRESYAAELFPGLTCQVWLTFHSRGMAAGRYSGEIAIEPGGLRVPITLTVYALDFPDQPTLHLGGWDYTHVDHKIDVTPENIDALINHLREHYVDTPWATSTVLTTGKYDQYGNMIETPNPENFETWLRRWPNAKNYFVFTESTNRFCGFEMGSAAFNRAVGSWITYWVLKLKTWNIKSEQLGLLIVDEPMYKKEFDVAIHYAKAIKRVQPDVKIVENIMSEKPWEVPLELYELSDILCINLPSLWVGADNRFRDFYRRQKEAGKTLWFYSCRGPGRLLDPYSYHRLSSWFSWKYGTEGLCFWAFGDSNKASSWNEYLAVTIGAYTPVFLDATSVTAGKHMAAIREGLEDYEYLKMLRDRIRELDGITTDRDQLASAKHLLETAADRVLMDMDDSKKYLWRFTKNRDTADRVREEILDALSALNNIKETPKR
jgi:hypothetical protein